MECQCGCGKRTNGGRYLPGHDQKLRSQLEASVGGLERLDELISICHEYASGRLKLEEFGTRIKDVINGSHKTS